MPTPPSNGAGSPVQVMPVYLDRLAMHEVEEADKLAESTLGAAKSHPEADDCIAVNVPVPQAGMMGMTAQGDFVFSAQFTFPAGFFKFQGSRLLGPDGQPASNAQMVGQAFTRLMPMLRLVVRKSALGEGVMENAFTEGAVDNGDPLQDGE